MGAAGTNSPSWVAESQTVLFLLLEVESPCLRCGQGWLPLGAGREPALVSPSLVLCDPWCHMACSSGFQSPPCMPRSPQVSPPQVTGTWAWRHPMSSC